MNRILFIGSFLSRSTGTYPVSEAVSKYLESRGYKTKLVSPFRLKGLRLIHVVVASFFSRYNVMHLDVFSGPAFLITEVAIAIAKFRRKKVIVTLHGGRLFEFFSDNKRRTNKFMEKADIKQTPSLYLQSSFRKVSIDLEYLPNPLDLSKFKKADKSRKRHTLLWVRAFNDIYNPALAIKTVYELKTAFPDVSLTMIGPDKGELHKTQNLINTLGLQENIDILGPIKNSDLHKFYQTHEVYINTTHYESFGVALVEAASCGIPIVSTCVGEIPLQWTDKQNILLCSNDPKEFARRVTELFLSKDLRSSLSKKARIKAQSFDHEEIIESWVSHLTMLHKKVNK